MAFKFNPITGKLDLVNPPGGVNSVSNSDGTLTISPTTGTVVASLNLGHANTWTVTQTFSDSTSIIANGDAQVDGFLFLSGGVLPSNADPIVNAGMWLPAYGHVGASSSSGFEYTEVSNNWYYDLGGFYSTEDPSRPAYRIGINANNFGPGISFNYIPAGSTSLQTFFNATQDLISMVCEDDTAFLVQIQNSNGFGGSAQAQFRTNNDLSHSLDFGIFNSNFLGSGLFQPDTSVMLADGTAGFALWSAGGPLTLGAAGAGDYNGTPSIQIATDRSAIIGDGTHDVSVTTGTFAVTGTQKLQSYSNGPLSVLSNAIVQTQANMALYAPVILASVLVNGFVVGATTIFTVPTGKTLITIALIATDNASSSVTAPPTAGFGTAAGTNDIFAATPLTGMTGAGALGDAFFFTSTGQSKIATSTTVTKFNVTVAATGTSLILRVQLIGFLY